jgi:hypothetical protein
MPPKIPLEPDRVVDFTWGLSLFLSHDEQERKFGEYVKNKWDALSEKYEKDDTALRYFESVNAAMSATIYHLAKVKMETNEGSAYLDSLQKRKIEDLDDLAKLSRDAESIATRIAGLTVGAGVSFLQLATNVLGAREIAYMGIGATVAYIVLEISLRLYRFWKAPRIMAEIKKQKEQFKTEQSEAKTKEIVTEFLKKLSSISEDTYGSKIEQEVITSLAASNATMQSGSFFTSGSVPTHFYPESGYPGAVSTYHAGDALRTNWDRKSKTNSDSETK